MGRGRARAEAWAAWLGVFAFCSISSPISLGFWPVGVIERRHRQAGWSLPQLCFILAEVSLGQSFAPGDYRAIAVQTHPLGSFSRDQP